MHPVLEVRFNGEGVAELDQHIFALQLLLLHPTGGGCHGIVPPVQGNTGVRERHWKRQIELVC